MGGCRSLYFFAIIIVLLFQYIHLLYFLRSYKGGGHSPPKFATSNPSLNPIAI